MNENSIGLERCAEADSGARPENVIIDPRVVFAAERTLLAWIRTSLALMGLGFVFARFGLSVREVGTSVQNTGTAPDLSFWVGIGFVATGVLMNVIAVRQHFVFISRLNRGETLYPTSASAAAIIAMTLATLGVVIAIYLFFFSSRSS